MMWLMVTAELISPFEGQGSSKGWGHRLFFVLVFVFFSSVKMSASTIQ